MKNLLLLIMLCLTGIISKAATYYVAPTGSDANPGTISQPFKSIGKLSSLMQAGDIAYVRGGTYNSAAGNDASIHFLIENINGTSGSPITIQAYPGEIPLFDCSNITPTNGNPFAFVINNSSYVRVKGLTIKNLKQISDGTGVSRGFAFSNSNNCTAELLNVFNIGGTGCTIINSDNSSFLNCDSHNNGDGVSPDTWNFGDGFTCTGGDPSTNIYFEGCRAWMNGDDGWDFFAWSGTKVTIKNCWSFWNSVKPWGISGTQPSEATMTPTDASLWANNTSYRTSTSSGEGFKLGGFNAGGPGPVGMPTTLKKYLDHCVSFENSGTGYAANMDAQYSHQMQLLNCIAYGNGNDGYGFATGRSVGIAMIFKNCIGANNNKLESGGDWTYDGLSTNVSNNVWMSWYNGINYGNLYPTVQATSADFLSVTSTGVAGSRQSDGTLPNLSFLKLAATSDLIDKGVNVGLPFSGNAPDLGAFESNGVSSNILPTANAGTDITITLPANAVTLSGNGTDPDGTIAAYAWTKLSGPTGGTITNAAAALTTVSGLVQGVYQFQLKVTDNMGGTSVDNIQVLVNALVINNPPTAYAGTDTTITLPRNSVSLTGTGTDADGTISAYLWTKISGPTGGTISTATAVATGATALLQGVYKFELKVTDNAGAIGRDTMQVTVNAAGNMMPVANAGADSTVVLPTSTVTLKGTGTDPDGTVASYAWSKVTGPANGTIMAATTATSSVTGLVQGIYKFELKVTDNLGAVARDTTQVTVSSTANPAPVANAGADKTIMLPTTTVSLTGTGTDANGTITAYAWAKLSGPANSVVTTPAAATTTVTALTQGVYSFELTVTDNAGATGKDTVRVIVNAPTTVNTAYGGVRWAIPGTVEAENFDIGGQNVAYYDNTNGNNGGLYRTSDYVDITTSSEGGYLVGWIVAGEWMKYSVNVASDGIYTITARVACLAKGKSFNIEMDGTVIATVVVPNTGGSQTWKTVTIKNVSLTAGDKTMRIVASNGSGFNINYVQFTATTGLAVRMNAADSTNEAVATTTVTTFPLPFSTSFSVNLYGETTGEYNLTLVDLTGKAVWKKTVTKSGATYTENIYMGNLADGVYILQVVSPDQTKTTHKLIKN